MPLRRQGAPAHAATSRAGPPRRRGGRDRSRTGSSVAALLVVLLVLAVPGEPEAKPPSGTGDAAAAAAALARGLQPHRAVYDLFLAEAEPSTTVVAARGRIALEQKGSPCAGYRLDTRFVTKVTDREGTTQVSDHRTATHETLDPATYTFENSIYVDGQLASRLSARAQARVDGTHVRVSAPREEVFTVDRALFPLAHTALVLDAAHAGERVVEAPVFTGEDDAAVVFDTTTIIGPARTGFPGATPRERAALARLADAAALRAWRLVVSYFPRGEAGGEAVPAFALAYTLVENGIVYDLAFDYVSLRLTGRLSELVALPASDC